MTQIPSSKKLGRIIVPLLLSVLIGALIYYGGDAYQAIGLTGIGTARLVFGYILGVAQFLVLAIFLQRLVQYVLLDWLVASAIGSQPPRLLGQISTVFIYVMAFTAVIGIVFKKDLTVVLAASGAAGIVIGIALQNLILDVFSGLALNLDRIVKIGDDIQLHRVGDVVVEGKIVEINWRAMQILDFDQNIVVIPNRLVFASTLTNFSAPQCFSRISIQVTLDGRVPVERARRVLESAAIEALATLSSPTPLPTPFVGVSEIIHVPRAVKYNVFIYCPFEKRPYCRNFVQQYILKHLNFSGIRPAWQTAPDTQYLAALIAITPLFYGIAEAESLLIATHAVLKKTAPNTTITQSGEIAETMCLLVEGLLTAETRRGIGTKPSPLEILSPGSLIGGVPMLMNDVYESTVCSKTACLLFEVNYALLEKLFTQYPKTIYLITQNIAKITTKNTSHSGQWQMGEADIASEILRNLKYRFIHLKL